MSTENQGVANPPLPQRMIAAVNTLRDLAKEYHLLTDDQQKAVRHQLYAHTGKFGKDIIVPSLSKFKEVEDGLINKGKA